MTTPPEGSVLDRIRVALAASPALGRKRDIGEATAALSRGPAPGDWPPAFGDDAASMPFGDGFLLLAADGIATPLLADPEWAGYCGVLVNVNDIVAMGGRPLAMVNVLAAADPARRALILKGVARASEHFGVPMVGGHLHPDEPADSLSVTILGSVRSPLGSFAARPGQRIVLAVDVTGHWHEPFPHWDSTSGRPSEEVRRHLRILPELVDAGLVAAGKDVSNPGILGTLLMLLETSEVGAHLCLDSVPRPPHVEIARWLECYPGFGFVLAVEPDCVARVLQAFRCADLTAEAIGEVREGATLTAELGEEEAVLWDLAARPVTGIRRAPAPRATASGVPAPRAPAPEAPGLDAREGGRGPRPDERGVIDR